MSEDRGTRAGLVWGERVVFTLAALTVLTLACSSDSPRDEATTTADLADVLPGDGGFVQHWPSLESEASIKGIRATLVAVTEAIDDALGTLGNRRLCLSVFAQDWEEDELYLTQIRGLLADSRARVDELHSYLGQPAPAEGDWLEGLRQRTDGLWRPFEGWEAIRPRPVSYLVADGGINFFLYGTAIVGVDVWDAFTWDRSAAEHVSEIAAENINDLREAAREYATSRQQRWARLSCS